MCYPLHTNLYIVGIVLLFVSIALVPLGIITSIYPCLYAAAPAFVLSIVLVALGSWLDPEEKNA